MTRRKKMRSLLSLYYYAAALLILVHPEVTKASPIPFQDLDFAVALTDETFEHETQASTGQTTGSWLVWFYNDKDREHRAILGEVPEGGTIFSEHHIVVGSVGLSKSTRTRQRFGIKPRDLPALIFIHKGKYYVYPKGSSEPFYFNWDSIVKFAFDIAGYKQPSSSAAAAAAEQNDVGGDGAKEEEHVAATEQENNSIFAKLQAHDIPDPKTDWDDFQDFLTSVVNEGGFFFICISVVFGGLGIAGFLNPTAKKEKPKKKQS